MPEVVLVYPYVDPPGNNSIFRFPPLGPGYIASHLREGGVSVGLVDCTFRGEEWGLRRVRELRPRVVGVYSMFTMRAASMRFARRLRGDCELLVAGGPLPSVDPNPYLDAFDVVVVGEGEETMLEIAERVEGDRFGGIRGIVYRERAGSLVRSTDGAGGEVVRTPGRALIRDLDSIPLPARDLFDNVAYLEYHRRRRRPPTTSLMSSRGCPFACDFCSKPVFGDTFRERSAANIADEVEEVLGLGYERVFFQDDCFTITRDRVLTLCDEVERRGLDFGWECLSRVDTLDKQMAARMRRAGCRRIFFGLESGSDAVLRIISKNASVERARIAVESAASAGIDVGAFFILGYPGETDETMLETIRFAVSLPLRYLSFSFPYPIPGTGLYERVRGSLRGEVEGAAPGGFVDQTLNYLSSFSEGKLKFAIAKAMIQHYMRRYLGSASPLFERPFGFLTDRVFKALK